MEKKISSVETQLKAIADTLGCGVDQRQIVEDEIRANSRKRLKERLTAAVTQQDLLFQANRATNLKERLFGICAQDNRLGKEGSRYCTLV